MSSRRLLLLIIALGLVAETTPLSASTIRWEASSGLLPTQTCPNWTNVGSPATSSGSTLVISTVAPGSNSSYYEQSGTDLSIPASLEIEFRVRYVSGTSEHGARAPIHIGIETQPYRGTLVGIGQDEVFYTSANLARGGTAVVDTDGSPHTYRIAVNGSTLAIFQDSNLILTGSTFFDSTTPAFSGRPDIFWGEASAGAYGVSEWEYFQHNASAVACAPCAPPPPGLVSWWPAEGNATDILDGNNGALVGGTFFNAGRVGQGFVFDSNDDRVVVPHNTNLDVQPSGFTADFWMKGVKNQPEPLATFFEKSHGWTDNTGWALSVFNTTTGLPSFAIGDGAGFPNITGSVDVLDGNWHHIAGTWDSGTMRFYVDGVLQGTASNPTPTNNTRAVNMGFTWGGGTPRRFFRGVVDELQVFDRALSMAELQAIVAAGAGGQCDDFTDPTIAVPEDAAYQCAGQVPPADASQATATDDEGPPIVTVTQASNGGAGSPASPLVLTRTWTATDAAGNSASDSQTITVVDNTAAVLTVPEGIELQVGPGTEPCNEVQVLVASLGTASAEDNCGPVETMTTGIPADNLYPVGVTTITYTATDAAGNVTTATQTVNVSCPVGAVAGTVTLSCNGGTSPASGATVRLPHEGTPFRDQPTGVDGSFSFLDVRLGTYTVQVVAPAGYALPIDTRVVTIGEENATLALEPFAATCLLGDITGRVEGTCAGSTVALQGVTFDLFREDGGMDVLVGSTPSDALGNYRFDDVALGDYTVGVVLPLGYSAVAASQSVSLTAPDGTLAVPSFELTCEMIAAEPRSMGYWKHQVNVYLTGKGHAQETLDDLLAFVDRLVEHFNDNLVNPVVVYVPGSANTTDKLLQLQQLLTVNKGATALDRAKRQLLALLLNVVSGKISQTQMISADGATVSQAITHSYDLIVDGNPITDGTAETICERINTGVQLAAGMVPITTRVITYREPRSTVATEFRLGAVTPNPMRGAGTISLTLPDEREAVVELFDVAGRVRQQQVIRGAGEHAVSVGDGLEAGLYLLRVRHGAIEARRKFAIVR